MTPADHAVLAEEHVQTGHSGYHCVDNIVILLWIHGNILNRHNDPDSFIAVDGVADGRSKGLCVEPVNCGELGSLRFKFNASVSHASYHRHDNHHIGENVCFSKNFNFSYEAKQGEHYEGKTRKVEPWYVKYKGLFKNICEGLHDEIDVCAAETALREEQGNVNGYSARATVAERPEFCVRADLGLGSGVQQQFGAIHGYDAAANHGDDDEAPPAVDHGVGVVQASCTNKTLYECHVGAKRTQLDDFLLEHFHFEFSPFIRQESIKFQYLLLCQLRIVILIPIITFDNSVLSLPNILRC